MGFLLQLPSSPSSFATIPVFTSTIIKASSSNFSIPIQRSTDFGKWVADFRSRSLNFAISSTLALSVSLAGVGFAEAKVGVNKPELLPKEYTPVIDVVSFLSDGHENRIAQEITAIEKDTGFKLRALAQNYPDTPGLAIKDYWQVDDRTIVFVTDPTFGNMLNFNVGDSVDLDILRSFWARLSGNMFYWIEKGEDASIESVVMAISSCLREPVGPNKLLRGKIDVTAEVESVINNYSYTPGQSFVFIMLCSFKQYWGSCI